MSAPFRSMMLLSLALVVGASGCGRLLNNLRRDLDDSDPYSEPVTGGRWSERGFLSADMAEAGSYRERYLGVGHSERTPASASYGGDVSQSSWVTPEQADASRRDQYRGLSQEAGDDAMPSFSTSPQVPPTVRRAYRNGRATRADFVDSAPSEGSLWASDGQTNYYFTKNKIRGTGDIVTINIEQDLYRDMTLEIRRTLTPREKEIELRLAQERIRRKALGLPPPDEEQDPKKRDQLASSASAPSRGIAGEPEGKPAKKEEDIDIPKAGLSDVDVAKTLEIKPGDTMMAEIVERYPNGNYKIRGIKKVVFKSGAPRLMNVLGVVRGADISEDDTVASGKLYEYKLEAFRQQ